MTTIFEQVGGIDAVNAAVDIFYDKVLADDRIKDFFASIDMDKQRQKQKKFFMMLFKGTADDADDYMRRAHQHLSLNDEHFIAVAENLEATLRELGVPDNLVTEIMTAAAGLHDAVLNI